jgi:hypothetical protein
VSALFFYGSLRIDENKRAAIRVELEAGRAANQSTS